MNEMTASRSRARVCGSRIFDLKQTFKNPGGLPKFLY